MNRLKPYLLPLLGCALLALPLGLYGLWVAAVTSNNDGSPRLAAEWRDALLAFPGPDEAAAADPDVVVLHFDNGEWLIGKSQDSHGIWRRGGGTMVTRDSRGRVRAFFGHMCGARFMQDGFGTKHPSANAFYAKVTENGGYVEHVFP